MVVKICSKCKAVFQKRRWIIDEKLWERLKRSRESILSICPGCQRIEKKYIEGIVTLGGDFLAHHYEEVISLIRSEAGKAKKKNVAARILNMEEKKNIITITTTDKVLAEHIGKEFKRAFSGHLRIYWPPKDKFVRVNWERE